MHGLYKTHSRSLSYLMGCGLSKTPWDICSAFKHILESELKLGSVLHTECYYVETVLTCPHGINFNRCYQFYKNQKPHPLCSFEMVQVKRLGVHKSNKPQTGGTPSLKTHLKSFLTHTLYRKTMSGANTGMALNPQLEPIPVLLPKLCIPLPPSHPEDDGEPRAGVPSWSWPR